MHDRNKLYLELGLYIMDNVLNSGGNRVMSHEGRVHNDAEVFHLQVDLVQGLKGASIIEVMVEWNGKVEVYDGSD